MAETPTWEPGRTWRGFRVVRVTPLPAWRAVAREFEHEASGARVMHFANDDPENLFSITVPTPPWDDTGAPHILEHSVLSGSRKYPVRQPFFEMLKMSMGTYINAFTAGDYTCYPVASPVKQDLFNLADVYFDAVFHPLLTEETFLREGHRLTPVDPQDPQGALTETGIVYNEMKGYYSRPEVRLWMEAEAHLLPDTVYARSSGGRPEAMVDLTYERLRRFYDAYYHPSNAFFFLYGDIPTEEYLAFLGPRLEPFVRRTVDPRLPRQPRWSAPRRVALEYQLGPGEDPREKTYLLLQWLAGSATDPLEDITLEVLDLFLLGNEAAPLRKALVDARLGQDLTHAGYRSVGQEAVFQVGLKGSEPDRADRFEALVLDTLRSLADGELPAEQLEAAFRQAAYHHLEILPMFPLTVRHRVVEAWRLGIDPFTYLDARRHLEACRAAWRADPRYFQRFLRERLVDNPHRLLTILAPSPDWQARQEAAFAERMRRVRASLTPEACEAIARLSAEVDARAATPNPPERVALLPQLRVADVPRRPRHIPTAVADEGGVTVLRNDVFSNGVNYLALDLAVPDLAPERWALVPRYVDALEKCGAAGYDYVAMAHRVAAATGGIGASPFLSGHAARRDGVRSLRISTKALDEQVDDALRVLEDLLFAVDPSDAERMDVLLTQALAAQRSQLINGGAGTALRHAGRLRSLHGQLEELMEGVSQLALLEAWSRDRQRAVREVADAVAGLRDFVLGARRLTVSFTGSDRAYDAVRSAVRRWAGRLRPEAPGTPVPDAVRPQPSREGLAGPVQVAYCAQVLQAPRFDDPDSPYLAVGAHLLTSEYVLPEIRFRGTAYGGSCTYDALEGQLAFLSWQDPHVVRTLRVFAGALDWVRRAPWTQADVDRAIVGTLRDAERPIRPGPATHQALNRHLAGLTPEVREARHLAVLGATVDAVRGALVRALEQGLATSSVAVLASRSMLEEANRELGAEALAVAELFGSRA